MKAVHLQFPEQTPVEYVAEKIARMIRAETQVEIIDLEMDRNEEQNLMRLKLEYEEPKIVITLDRLIKIANRLPPGASPSEYEYWIRDAQLTRH